MQEKKYTFRFYSMTRVLLVVGIVVLVNILLSPVSVRLDLTQAKLFTLSSSTKNVLQNLENPVTFKVFFSDANELPQSLIRVRQEVFDLVEEYRKVAPEKVIVEQANPKDDDTIRQEARDFGVPEIQFSKYGDKELEIKTGFSGMAIIYQEKARTIPIITSVNNLEFDMSAAINKISRENDPIVGLLTDNGSRLSEEVKEELRKQYILRDVSIEANGYIEDSVSALIISGSDQEYSDWEKFVIDQFVMRGGKLIVLQDGVRINNAYFTASFNDVSINSVVGNYGVRVNRDVVLDPISHQVLIFQSESLSVPIAYPAYPKIIPEGLDRNHLITASLPSMTFAFASSLSVDQTKLGENTQAVELVKTTDKSFAIDGNGAFLGPKQLKEYDPLETEPQTLAVLVTGKLSSAFEGEQIPQKPSNVDKEFSEIIPSIGNGQVLVVGSSRFLQENVLTEWPENVVFLANALDVMVAGDTLIDIRSRTLANRPLEPVEESQARKIRYTNIFASVILSVLVGFAAFAKRRRDSKIARTRYS